MAFSSSPAEIPYGESANRLLSSLQPALRKAVEQVTDDFYDLLASAEKTAKIIGRLSPEEFSHLKQRQKQHVLVLVSPDLELPRHQALARRAGLAHAHVGVEFQSVIEAYDLYEKEIFGVLRRHVCDADAREALMRIIMQRIIRDLEAQVASYRKLNVDAASIFLKIDQHIMTSSSLPEIIRQVITTLGDLGGDVASLFLRPNASGVFEVEDSYGAAAERFHLAMTEGSVENIGVDPSHASGQGPAGAAWRSGEIITLDAWDLSRRLSTWWPVGQQLGVRSGALVPLTETPGTSCGLLLMFSAWPGYFSTTRIYSFLVHIQRVLGNALQRCHRSPVTPLRDQQEYRRMLADKSVIMLYQPIVDLDGGELVKIEALARLQGANGQLITPQQFLPAFGQVELLQLFVAGLERTCADCMDLETAGLQTRVAINLPAEAFSDSRYQDAFFRILGAFAFPPSRFTLELLETEDSAGALDSHLAFMQRLHEAGVSIAQDDLGAGHSSLLRLDRYPFDEVKIDQNFVRGALRNPKRAIDFILYLTRLAHAFDMVVTVEGLENQGMLEAAAIMGADRGQGFEIGRPMPAMDLIAWKRNYRHPITPGVPTTAIGALAGFLLWDLQLKAISDRPEMVEEFVGARAMVDRFIDANGLEGSWLQTLVNRNHELASQRQRAGDESKAVRSRVIEELSKHWQLEVAQR